MSLLEEEIRKQEQRVEELRESGVLDEYEEFLERDLSCNPESIQLEVESYKTIETEVELYGLEELEPKLARKKREIHSCLSLLEAELQEEYSTLTPDSSIEAIERWKEKATVVWQAHESTDKHTSLENLIESTNYMKERISERVMDRFRNSELQEEYDEEYHELKSRFDSLDVKSKKSLKKLRNLAEETERLSDKYRFIDDKEGLSQSALLHEDVEQAAERLAPIYEGWKRKNVTIGLLLMTSILGFWKGHVIKEHIQSYFTTEQQTISLPQAAVSGAIQNSSRYVLYFDITDDKGRLYDVQARTIISEFPFTANAEETPIGSYTITGIEEIVTGKQISGESVVVTETASTEYLEAIEKGWMVTDGEIALKENDMDLLYNIIQDDVDNTSIVVNY